MRGKLVYIFLFLFSPLLQSAEVETGLPFIANFSPRDYHASTQNWSIAQHQNGFIYIANSKGVLEFDGAHWRLIPMANNAAALSISVANDGTLFVGGKSEFGYLAPDSTGTLVYFSLLSHLAVLDRDFGDVWEVISLPHDVYFRSSERLFRLSLNDSTFASPVFETWKPKNSFHFSFRYKNTVLIRDIGHGLFFMQGDSLQLLPDGTFFAAEPVYAFLPQPDSSFLVVSRTKGFFRYNGSHFSPWNSPVSDVIKKHRAIQTIQLKNGYLAMATNAGVLFVNELGDIVHQVNKNIGLRDDTVWTLLQDDQGGVWCALNNGIARIELPSPITLFDDRTALDGTAQDIIRHNGRLYVAISPSGVYYLASTDESVPFAHFVPVENIPYQSWQFATLAGKLLVATTDGVYEITGNRATNILPTLYDIDAASLLAVQQNSSRLFIGLFDGLATVTWNRNRWVWEGSIDEIDDEIRNIVQDKNGVLWLGTRSNGIYRMQYTDSLKFKVTNLEHFSVNEGLPTGQVFPFMVDGRLVITTENLGLYSFDETTKTFLPELGFGTQFSNGSRDVEIIAQKDSGAAVWLGSEEAGRIDQLIKTDGRYVVQSNTLQRLPESAIRAIYPDEHDVLWISSNDGLFRYDPRIVKNISPHYKAFVRRVVILPDSLLFGGAQRSSFLPVIQHSQNSLRFEFSAVSYDANDEILFQTCLLGFEKSWSKWTSTTYKEYTNLPPVRYTFQVRARDIYGRTSDEDVYSFRVLPPFYRTWYAYTFYVIVFCGFAFGIDRLQRRRLYKRAQERTRIALLEAENKRKSEELEQARELQVSMLPKELPQVPDATIAVYMNTATEVGGDYYDFVVKDGEFTGAIGDATGHGLNAGMMVSIIKGFFVTEAANMSILQFFKKCNIALKQMNLKRIYMSFTLFKIRHKKLLVSSAGMPPLYIYRARDKKVQEIVLKGMPLGAVRSFDYQYEDIDLDTGDTLFFMSDGFPELFNPENEMIGYDRIPDILQQCSGQTPNYIIVDLVDYANKWANGRAQDDDMTFVVIQIK